MTETVPAKLYKIDICHSADDYMRTGDTYQIEEIFIPEYNVVVNCSNNQTNVFFADRTRLEGSIRDDSKYKFNCTVCRFSTNDEGYINSHKLSDQHIKKMARINDFKNIVVPKELADKLKQIVDMNKQIEEMKQQNKLTIKNLFTN